MQISSQLDRYESVVGEETIRRIHKLARLLNGKRIVHYNTTAQGGGVAELLQTLLPLLEEMGIKHSWNVVPLDDESNHFAARIVDMLQGNDPGEISFEERRRYLSALLQSPTLQHPEEHQADIYMVHDFQLVPLGSLFPWIRPALWFCHIDTAEPNLHAKEYVKSFLGAYELSVFNSPASVFPELSPDRTKVITLGIDPFRCKNTPMDKSYGLEVLRACGIDTERPVITQVARFGRWKNPWQVIDIYRIVKQQIPGVQVALVGAMAAKDDIKALEVLEDVRRYAGDDPDVHLLYDPVTVNDDAVNAFQRFSDVILQRSSREGFGLTVTEAMWKYQPVVGTTATGLKLQIEDGKTGFLVDDPQLAAERVLTLLTDRDLYKRMGEQAHEHVRQNFLFPVIIEDYLESLWRVIDNTRSMVAD